MIHNRKTAVIITCEHAGNRVPKRCRALLLPARPLLETHRGYDIGALPLARDLAKALHAPLFFTTFTRLLVDANRSRHNRRVFSEFTAGLNTEKKENILRTWYDPYRQTVEARVRKAIDRQQNILHLSIHSFIPILNGVLRNADIGFLYDPARSSEKQWVDLLIRSFNNQLPDLRYRRNYPYRGISDSLTAWLRKKHDNERYCGIEIEVNQKLAQQNAAYWRTIRHGIVDALIAAMSNGL